MALSGCQMVQESVPVLVSVEPLPPIRLSTICIDQSGMVRDDHESLVSKLLNDRGIRTPSRAAAFRGECDIWLRYWLTTAGNLPKYLYTFELTVYDNNRTIGKIIYDAAQAHGRPDRHGPLRSKINPLLDQLLARATITAHNS